MRFLEVNFQKYHKTSITFCVVCSSWNGNENENEIEKYNNRIKIKIKIEIEIIKEKHKVWSSNVFSNYKMKPFDNSDYCIFIS